MIAAGGVSYNILKYDIATGKKTAKSGNKAVQFRNVGSSENRVAFSSIPQPDAYDKYLNIENVSIYNSNNEPYEYWKNKTKIPDAYTYTDSNKKFRKPIYLEIKTDGQNKLELFDLNLPDKYYDKDKGEIKLSQKYTEIKLADKIASYGYIDAAVHYIGTGIHPPSGGLVIAGLKTEVSR